jgi:hypothetical protein
MQVENGLARVETRRNEQFGVNIPLQKICRGSGCQEVLPRGSLVQLCVYCNRKMHTEQTEYHRPQPSAGAVIRGWKTPSVNMSLDFRPELVSVNRTQFVLET